LIQYEKLLEDTSMTTKTLYILLLSSLFLGCTPTLSKHPQPRAIHSALESTSSYIPPNPEKEEIFQKVMHSIGLQIQDDDAYQYMDFDTPHEKKWFKILTYRLWDRQITRQQFLSEGLSKYPQNKYEFEFIIRHFTV